MVSPEGVVKLMDFGIAFRENDEQTALTLEGHGPMTLEYASPEQLRGMPASAASDIYALGLVLLELLCRKPPRMLINNATLELGIFIQRQPQPEAWRDLGELIPRMLAYDPGERPGSAEDVRKRLKRLPEPVIERVVDKAKHTAVTAIRPFRQPVSEPPRPLKPHEPETVIVKAGGFLMGREPGEGVHGWETPRHSVDLDTYHMGVYPVTNEQYAAFLEARPEHPEPGEKAGWLNRMAPPEKLDHPVVAVSFFDALAYCAWLSLDTGKNYLLPTEAQWEKATGAHGDRLFPWEGPWDDSRCHVNALTTSPVTSYEKGKSIYGCFHMIGNVQEWTRTQWGEDPGESSFPYPYRHDDGRNNTNFGTQQPFVIHRGGSFRDEPTRLDCRARGLSHPSGKFLWRGFRVVLEDS
jgi:formylglycine-generating enzyme required for sulfatase activity